MIDTVIEAAVPLTAAAHQLGLSWQQAWRALLVGQLSGEKRGGRWFVYSASVAELAGRLSTRETT